jgi:hypothetical protein
MSPAKVFGIIVRTVGLFLLVYAIWYIIYGVAAVLGLQTPPNYKIGYFLSGFVFLAISLYFLRGAQALLKFCYPAEKE